MFPCECLNGAISLRKYLGIPLSHLLNAKSSFISWRRSAFFEVYNWALRYHLSSGISFSAYNDDGVVSIFRHYNNNFHSFLFFCKFHSNFLNINHYQENIGLHMIHSNMYSKEIFGVSPIFCFCAHDQDQSYLTLQAVDAKTYIGTYILYTILVQLPASSWKNADLEPRGERERCGSGRAGPAYIVGTFLTRDLQNPGIILSFIYAYNNNNCYSCC